MANRGKTPLPHGGPHNDGTHNDGPRDQYVAGIFTSMDIFAAGPPAPPPALNVKGETTNHTEGRLITAYGKNPTSARAAVLEWYGPLLLSTGDERGECVLPASHRSHYSGPRSAALQFALRAGHQDVIDLMLKVLKSDFAKLMLFADPALTAYASPCTRLLDGADQRGQLIVQAQWLKGRKIRVPATLRTAADWLGLYALIRIQEAYDHHEPWALSWPDIRKEIISATRADLLPLKRPVCIERGPKGHVAYFMDDQPLARTACQWALLDYTNPGHARYGVGDPTTKHGLKGAILESAQQRPECPGGKAEIFDLPVVR